MPSRLSLASRHYPLSLFSEREDDGCHMFYALDEVLSHSDVLVWRVISAVDVVHSRGHDGRVKGFLHCVDGA